MKKTSILRSNSRMHCVARFESVFNFGAIKFKRHVFKFYFDMFTRFIKNMIG